MHKHIIEIPLINKLGAPYFGGTSKKISWALGINAPAPAKLILIMACSEMGGSPYLKIDANRLMEICGIASEISTLLAIQELINRELIAPTPLGQTLTIAPNFYFQSGFSL